MKNTNKARSKIAAVIIAVIAVIVIASGIVVIPTGYTGVRSTFGQIDSKPIPNGISFKIPFVQTVEKVNNKQQDVTFRDQIWSETNQRTAIYYENVTVTYQINPEKSAWIYAHVTNYRDNLVSSGLVSSAIKSASKVLSDTDATNRSVIEPEAMAAIQAALDEKYGENVVLVNKVVIENADFEDSYNAAIAAKQKAQLEAEQQAIENQREIDKAVAEAQVIKTKAEAQAEAKIIEAQAQAEANRLLEESLSEDILRKQYIDKWNGELPQVLGGDNPSLLIDMSNENTEQ
ncbi:MAG: hypothetical protein IJH99_08620 [Eubacterium sp.]|nr:hypothetical protein [Eubacterium sp.]